MNGNIKSWSSIKEQLGFENFANVKLNICNTTLLEKIIKEAANADNVLLPNHHLIQKTH